MPALTAAGARADSAPMRTRLALALLSSCLALAPAAVQSADDTAAGADAKRTGNVLRLRQHTPAAPAQDATPTVASFVELATTKDIDAVYKTFGDLPVRANGELALKHYLATEVMPFFADAARLDRHLRVVGATFDDDSTGQIAYAYAVTKAGRLAPFTIAWRVEGGRAKLMDVKVGRCVPARHPVLPGGCGG